MKNLTVSVPDDVYRRARIRAAEQGRSVSALVTEYLTAMNEDEDARFQELLGRQRKVTRRIRSFRATDRLGRDEVHRRAVR